MVSRRDGHVIVTCWGFAKLMTELAAIKISIRKNLPRKTYIISRATMHGYCFQDCIHKSACTIPLAFVLTRTVVSDTSCIVVTLALRTTCVLLFFQFSQPVQRRLLYQWFFLLFGYRLRPRVPLVSILASSSTVLLSLGQLRLSLKFCQCKMFQGGQGPRDCWQSWKNWSAGFCHAHLQQYYDHYFNFLALRNLQSWFFADADWAHPDGLDHVRT